MNDSVISINDCCKDVIVSDLEKKHGNFLNNDGPVNIINDTDNNIISNGNIKQNSIPLDINDLISQDNQTSIPINTNEFANAAPSKNKKRLLIAGFDPEQLESSSTSPFADGIVKGSTLELSVHDSKINPINNQLTKSSRFRFVMSSELNISQENARATIITDGFFFYKPDKKNIGPDKKNIGPDKKYIESYSKIKRGNLYYYFFESNVKANKEYYGKSFTVFASIHGTTYRLELPEIKYVGEHIKVKPPNHNEVIMVATKIDPGELDKCETPGHDFYKLVIICQNIKPGKATPKEKGKFNKNGGFPVVIIITETTKPKEATLVNQFHNYVIKSEKLKELTKNCKSGIFPPFESLGQHKTIGNKLYKTNPNHTIKFSGNILESIVALKENTDYLLQLTYDNEDLEHSYAPQLNFDTIGKL